MKQFMKRLAGFSLGPILGAAISLILFPIFTNALSVDEYGRAGTFETLIVQIPNFIYIGMDQAFTREYNLFEDKRRLMQQAMMLPLMVGTFLIGIAVIFSVQFSDWLFESGEYYYIIWYACIWVFATIIERFILLSIRMQEKAIEFSFFSLLLKVGNFIISMGMILVGIRDFRVVVYGIIFGQVLADLVLFIRYRSLLDFSGLRLDTELIRKMFIFGIPIMISTSLAAALNSLDIIVLREVSTNIDIAIYKAGSKIGSIIGIMKTAFASFWIPTAYRWYEEQKPMKHYKYISDIIMFLLSGLFFVILVLRTPISLILSPDGEYLDVQYIVALLAFPHIMYTLSETTTLGIVFSRKTHYNIIVSVLSLAVSVIVNFALTPFIGFRGAALASTGAYTVFYLARTYFSSKTGFYFGQKKQFITMLLMITAGLINLYPIDYSMVYTIVLGILALIVQIPTIKTTLEIKKDSSNWDFS